jgi:hypothetical protein
LFRRPATPTFELDLRGDGCQHRRRRARNQCSAGGGGAGDAVALPQNP